MFIAKFDIIFDQENYFLMFVLDLTISFRYDCNDSIVTYTFRM